MTTGFRFSTATEADLETLILWMADNHDVINKGIVLELDEWITGDRPDFTNLHDFLEYLEWLLEMDAD